MKKAVSKLVTFLILSSLLLTGCKGSAKQNKQPALLEPVNVTENYETVAYRDISTLMSYEAMVKPYSTDLSFTTDGVFDKFYITIGDQVKKGQLLASQSDEVYEKELKQLQLNYDEMKTNYENDAKTDSLNEKLIIANIEKAKRDLKQADSDNKIMLEYTIEKLNIDMKTLKRNVQIKREEYNENLSEISKKIDKIKEEMKTNDIVAPYDGTILAKVDLEKGSGINAKSSVIQIADTSKSYISCNIEQLFQIEKADRIYAMFDGVNYDIVYSKDVSKDQQSTLQVSENTCRFTFKNKEDNVEFGEIGLVCLMFDYKENVLSASNKSIYTEGINKHYVYRSKDGQKEKVYVEVGPTTNLYTEIISGLEEGDVIYSE